jgi:hypothetical protein
MLMDYEQQLTSVAGASGGENIRPVAATPAYGSRPYFQKGAADIGLGDVDAALLFKVKSDYNSLTSMDIALVACDDAADPGATTAGTNEVVLVTKTFTLAQLVAANGTMRVGVAPPGSRKKTLRVKCSTTGTTPTTGSLQAWIQTGDDSTPANAGYTI